MGYSFEKKAETINKAFQNHSKPEPKINMVRQRQISHWDVCNCTHTNCHTCKTSSAWKKNSHMNPIFEMFFFLLNP